MWSIWRGDCYTGAASVSGWGGMGVLVFLLALGSAAAIAFSLCQRGQSLGEALRDAFFQASSMLSSTGFTSVDYNEWPGLARGILLMLMIVGACAGSTGCGFKVSRMLLVLKSTRRYIHQVLSPQKIQTVRMDRNAVDEKLLVHTNAYLAACVCILCLSFLAISADGFSVTTNLSAVVACFNNMGPGLEAVGPAETYAAYSVWAKLVLIFDMLAGRLEIFPILIFFSRSTWKK